MAQSRKRTVPTARRRREQSGGNLVGEVRAEPALASRQNLERGSDTGGQDGREDWHEAVAKLYDLNREAASQLASGDLFEPAGEVALLRGEVGDLQLAEPQENRPGDRVRTGEAVESFASDRADQRNAAGAATAAATGPCREPSSRTPLAGAYPHSVAGVPNGVIGMSERRPGAIDAISRSCAKGRAAASGMDAGSESRAASVSSWGAPIAAPDQTQALSQQATSPNGQDRSGKRQQGQHEREPARFRESGPVEEATQKLVSDLRLMKRTRFNAQERFEAKQVASVSAFTLATIVEIALSLAGSNFGSSIAPDVMNFIEYASQVTAVFILGFGLVVALAGYETKALHLQRSAMDWGNLSRELQIARPVSRDVLQDFRRRYHEIEGRCPVNHSAVDYHRARLPADDLSANRRNRIDYFIDVYLIYLLSAVAYGAFWIALWRFLAPGT